MRLKVRLTTAGVLSVLTFVPIRANHGTNQGRDTVLYVWAGDQARVAGDILAVIEFDENSANYGKVITTVPVPPPGNVGNEPHHCHLSADQKILGCGGLLSLLKGQNGIIFFDVTDKRNPRFLLSAKAVESSITDDFLPIPEGGFLITQMGAADGTSPGRVAEFDGSLHFVAQPLRDSVSVSGMALRAAIGRLQPPWHIGSPGSEHHDDLGFHSAGQHAQCISGRSRAPRFGTHLGLTSSG